MRGPAKIAGSKMGSKTCPTCKGTGKVPGKTKPGGGRGGGIAGSTGGKSGPGGKGGPGKGSAGPGGRGGRKGGRGASASGPRS
jgi:translation initiation factor IF-2